MKAYADPVFSAKDRFVAGAILWRYRQRCIEAFLHESEDSAEDAAAFERWRCCEFACKFGRPLNERGRKFIYSAVKAGIPEDALALLVNAELITANGVIGISDELRVRRKTAIGRAMSLLAGLELVAVMVFDSTPVVERSVIVGVLLCLLGFFTYVVELYGGRPLVALVKTKRDLSSFHADYTAMTPSNVIPLPLGR